MEQNEYTVLPFYNNFTAAKLFAVFAIILIVYLIVKSIIHNRSLTIHRAPFAVVTGYIGASIVNIILFTFLYWQWALPISIIVSVIYAFTTNKEVNAANSEERAGVWGLNKDIRRIRGELFNDMSIEQQLKYRKNVKHYKFNYILFVIVTVGAALAFVGICCLCDIGYLFSPVLIDG